MRVRKNHTIPRHLTLAEAWRHLATVCAIRAKEWTGPNDPGKGSGTDALCEEIGWMQEEADLIDSSTRETMRDTVDEWLRQRAALPEEWYGSSTPLYLARPDLSGWRVRLTLCLLEAERLEGWER